MGAASGALVVVFGSFPVVSVPFMGAMVGTVVSFIVVLLRHGHVGRADDGRHACSNTLSSTIPIGSVYRFVYGAW
jgi:hypothetical protein